MAESVRKKLSAEQQKKIIGEEIWLKYYNQTLFEKGLITERERNLMINRIDSRTSKAMSR